MRLAWLESQVIEGAEVLAEHENAAVRLAQLRQRWESDKSSRLFLQLAEEYRRQGQPEEAIAVLDDGLRHSPSTVAAQVALGRCRLEAGHVGAATETLEAVVVRDPTQMVAYRYLIEAYLQQHDPGMARDRLELYAQLNPQDPDIAALTRRIEEMEAIESTAPHSVITEEHPTPTAAPPPPAQPETLDREDEEDAALVEPVAAELDEDHAATMTSAEPAVPPPPPADAESSDAADGELPTVPSLPRPDWSDGSGAESATAPSPASVDSEVDAPADDATVMMEVPEPAEDWSAADRLEPEQEEPLPLAVAGGGADLVFALDSSLLPPAAELYLVPTRPLRRSPWPGDGAEEASSTATLGSLYLEQGHAPEAEQVFREVLESDPANEEARSGLEKVSLEHSQPSQDTELSEPLTAMNLLDGFEPQSGGLTERKAHVLRKYLGRIRPDSDVS